MRRRKLVAWTVLVVTSALIIGGIAEANRAWYEYNRMDMSEHHVPFWPCVVALLVDIVVGVAIVVPLIVLAVLLVRWALREVAR